ncbi:MAG: protein kinase, partial [Planctomycetota bacterium]
MKYGDYTVVSELGRGGMGVVYRARSASGAEVALKVLGRSASSASLQRFDRERRVQASLGAAEGFVSLLDAGASSEGPWIAMPLLTGGSLRDKLRRGPLTVDESLELVRALADALAR